MITVVTTKINRVIAYGLMFYHAIMNLWFIDNGLQGGINTRKPIFTPNCLITTVSDARGSSTVALTSTQTTLKPLFGPQLTCGSSMPAFQVGCQQKNVVSQAERRSDTSATKMACRKLHPFRIPDNILVARFLGWFSRIRHVPRHRYHQHVPCMRTAALCL